MLESDSKGEKMNWFRARVSLKWQHLLSFDPTLGFLLWNSHTAKVPHCFMHDVEYVPYWCLGIYLFFSSLTNLKPIAGISGWPLDQKENLLPSYSFYGKFLLWVRGLISLKQLIYQSEPGLYLYFSYKWLWKIKHSGCFCWSQSIEIVATRLMCYLTCSALFTATWIIYLEGSQTRARKLELGYSEVSEYVDFFFLQLMWSHLSPNKSSWEAGI